jgi:hypothetical protein
MRTLSKNMLTLWLALTLVITPLQAMTKATGAADTGGGPCATHAHTAPEAGTDSHSHHTLTQDPAVTHCPACSDAGCYDECSAQSCVSLQPQPAAIATAPLHNARNAATRLILQPTTVFSRTDPPLLRPPV